MYISAAVGKMTSQVFRHQVLRFGSYLVSQNRHITKCTQKLNTVLTHRSGTVVQFTKCLSTSPKFEALNVQNADDFKDRVLGSSTPVIVDFHATWCGPCKLLGPRLESIAASKAGKVKLAKIDVDDNAELAMEYGVQSVPTVLGIRNGKVLDKFIGLQDDDQLQTFVEKLIH